MREQITEPQRATDSTTTEPRTVADVRDKIAEIRSTRGVLGFKKNQQVAELVLSAIKQRGTLFNDGLRGYLFLHQERKLISLDLNQPQLEVVLAAYNLFPNEHVTKQ